MSRRQALRSIRENVASGHSSVVLLGRLITRQGLLPRQDIINNLCRVGVCKIVCSQPGMRLVDVFRWDRVKFRNPAADKATIEVKFFTLSSGIEYAEIRRCISPGTRGPLPTAIVGWKVSIDQLLHRQSGSRSGRRTRLKSVAGCRAIEPDPFPVESSGSWINAGKHPSGGGKTLARPAH